ncbi:MAG: class I SAM-dependent methyltransferase [Saprospiraceae bacterium]|nr:class I SAM-dependent methyltransferase [Saprospiraceae bacterium]
MSEDKKVKFHCPVCDNASFTKWKDVKDHSISGEVFPLADCSNCGLRCTLQAPDESVCGVYYQSQEYISHSDSREGFVFRLYHIVRNVMLSRKAKLVTQWTKEKTLLDVGCGTGYFAGHMAKRGYHTTGVEVDDQSRNYAQQKFGIPVYPPSDMFNGNIGGRFSVITLWHVMEHLYNPGKYWELFHEKLEENGVLIIAVPNRDGVDATWYDTFWAGYDVPRHLWHFTPSTMTKLASRYGFYLQSMKSMPFDPFYNALLSEKYKKSALGWIKAIFIGFSALTAGLISTKKASSIIYVFKKLNGSHS